MVAGIDDPAMDVVIVQPLGRRLRHRRNERQAQQQDRAVKLLKKT
jgi:hypothetical protein